MLLGAGSDKIDPSSVILSPTFSYLSRLNSTRVHRPANRSASDTNRAWRPALDRRRVSKARRRAARGRMVRQHQQPAHPPIFLRTARHSRSTTADRVGKRIFDDFGLVMIWSGVQCRTRTFQTGSTTATNTRSYLSTLKPKGLCLSIMSGSTLPVRRSVLYCRKNTTYSILTNEASPFDRGLSLYHPQTGAPSLLPPIGEGPCEGV